VVIALLSFAVAAVVVCVLFARTLRRQQRRIERIGRRVATLELDTGPTLVVEPAAEDTQPRIRSELLN
jgi:uncharacterized protein YoxC